MTGLRSHCSCRWDSNTGHLTPRAGALTTSHASGWLGRGGGLRGTYGKRRNSDCPRERIGLGSPVTAAHIWLVRREIGRPGSPCLQGSLPSSALPFSSFQTPVLSQLLSDLAPVLFLPSRSNWLCCPGPEQGHWGPVPQALCGCLRPKSHVPAGRG